MDIDAYNPYPSFQPGQKEAITQILDLHESGEKVVELNAPTAAGKTLDLFVLGKVLSAEYGIDKVVYTTPLVALVNQLENNKAFSSMPVLKGKRNYRCALLGRDTRNKWFSADDCPFDIWGDAIKTAWREDPDSEGEPCKSCAYQHARIRFMNASFGATTLARYMVDPSIMNATSVLLIDESAGLEKTLIDRATLILPEQVDLDNLVDSLTIYFYDLTAKISRLNVKLSGLTNLAAIVDLKKQITWTEREAKKCAKVLGHIDNKDPYIIDKDRKFRLLEGNSEFNRLASGVEFCVLASGTPATSILTNDYKSVVIQHPIPVERRICYYRPIGSMNYKERAETAPKMAAVIEELHGMAHKHTIVHCGAYNIAKLIYGNLSSTAKRITVLQDQSDREGSKVRFLSAKECIFLSVEFVEGLDLKGPEYPMNIIAKIPFENIKDEYVVRRNERDGFKRYNMHAAVAVMQAAGRCTRSIDDFSYTFILDSSWQGFFNRCKRLFQPWFVTSLKRYQEQPLEALHA